MEKCQKGNSLAAYSTSSTVLNGGDEETYHRVTRLVPTHLSRGKHSRALPAHAACCPDATVGMVS